MSNRLPTLLWIGISLVAALVGYDLGRKQPDVANTGKDKEVVLQKSFFQEHAVSNVVAAAGKSVVHIEVENKFPANSGEHVVPHLTPIGPSKKTGSGVVVRADGFILTSYHVVSGAKSIKVHLPDGRTLDGTVVGHDGRTDLALVQVDAVDLQPARLGDSRAMKPGDWAIAIGSPMWLDHTVSLGIISGVGRNVPGTSAKVDLIQTDAAINPGNSGGPLLNIHGEVIGINTAVRHDAQNIGFAIPIEVARDVAEQLAQQATSKNDDASLTAE